MEFKAVDHIFPEWNIWQQFLYSVQGLAFDRDAMLTTHPVEQEVKHPRDIDQMFDVISYAKGKKEADILMCDPIIFVCMSIRVTQITNACI